jgi:hypothetical protein
MGQKDFYYVLQEVDFRNGVAPGYIYYSFANSQIYSLAASPTLIDTSPQTTQCTFSTTSSVDDSVTGSVGWNASQGLNAALTGGVSISKSETITCPQFMIANLGDPGSGIASWNYSTSPLGVTPADGLQSFYNQWIWVVPFLGYTAMQIQQKQISIGSEGFVDWHGAIPFNDVYLHAGLTSVVPLPFGDTFALQNPTVLSVNPTCIKVGDDFVVNGTGFYPALVTSVVIGGAPLSSAEFIATSDTSIGAVTPNQPGSSQPVVVQTAEGLSNSNVTINISTSGSCQ